jgi:hypothetical protein
MKAFARGYSGAAYAKKSCSIKLVNAYKRLSTKNLNYLVGAKKYLIINFA